MSDVPTSSTTSSSNNDPFIDVMRWGWSRTGDWVGDVGTDTSERSSTVDTNVTQDMDTVTQDMEYNAHTFHKQLLRYNVWRAELIERKMRDITKLPPSEQSLELYRRDLRKVKRLIDLKVPFDQVVYDVVAQRVESVEFTERHMFFVTHPVVLSYHHASGVVIPVKLGQFKVRVEACSQRYTEIRVSSHKNNVHVNERLHPHLHQSDWGDYVGACWGTYGEMLKLAIDSGDVALIIATMVDYLNSFNSGDWYEPVRNFMTLEQREEYNLTCSDCGEIECCCNDEDWCGDCNNHVEECRCNECEGCGNYNEDCECIRCPDNNDQLEDNQFPDTACFGCRYALLDKDRDMWLCKYESELTTPYGYHATYIDDAISPDSVGRNIYLTREDGVITNQAGEVVT